MKTAKNKSSYDHTAIEAKWQEAWESDKTYSPNITEAKKPFYNLMMFPYPSAEGLHVGNMYAFTGADVYGRFQRMQGNDVFEPIGLDGFGIHSENYALKVGRHPKEQAKLAEKNFYRQLRSIGNSFDLTRTLETYDPEYYRWTQWLFIELFKAGLAYRKKAEVNWCPSCKTVLSDEQVLAGECERCGSTVEKRELEQWFFRITNYADRLLNNIDSLNWTEKVKIAQRNWIGKSEGAEVSFELVADSVQGVGLKTKSSKLPAIKVFTTRPDTLYGATFMVVSPEHELVTSLLAESRSMNQELRGVREYVEQAKVKTDMERTAEGKEKTGVLSGVYAINPVNGKEIPVWIADYVLSGYGTGAIMAVPAHDQRDFEFANKYNLEIIPLIQSKDVSSDNVKMTEASIGHGTIMGSDNWNGFHVPQDMGKVIDDLEARGIGTRKVNYHLRDWLISRQRYWGPPIPMVFCKDCEVQGKSWFTTEEGKKENESRSKNQELREKTHDSSFMLHDSVGMAGWYPVPDDRLPVLLPDVSDWKPMGTGKAPLANHPEFYEATCPECNGPATRETDVSDTFLDSAWYFLRYPNTDISTDPFDADRISKWLPVDQYTGGAEHSVLHLLYSRFITMALHDLGYLNFEEPFSRFFAHGLIIKDGAKMSKSKGNVVVPDEYIAKYGADALRTYLMFIGPFSDGGDFSDSGIEGMSRFLKRVWRMFDEVAEEEIDSESNRMMHKTIQKVTGDIGGFHYNTAIAALMEWYNFLNQRANTKNQKITPEEATNYLKLLAPFAPHMAEELYQNSKPETPNSKFESIHLSAWPEFDPAQIESDTVTIVVQVNGKRRGEFQVERGKMKDEKYVQDEAKKSVPKYVKGKEIKKSIYIPGKIVNFVV